MTVAAVTACDHIPWVGNTALRSVQLTCKHSWGGGFLLGVGFVTENIANLGSVGNLFPIPPSCISHAKVHGLSPKIIQSMNCICWYLHQKFLSILQMLADSTPCFLSWTWSPPGKLDTAFSHLFPQHSLCKGSTHTDCRQHYMSEAPNILRPPSPWELLRAS